MNANPRGPAVAPQAGEREPEAVGEVEPERSRAALNPRSQRRWLRLARRVAVVMVLFALWEVWTRGFDVNPLIFPSFSTVLVTAGERIADGRLLGYAGQTIRLLIISHFIATAVALLLTGLGTMLRPVRDLLETVTAMFNPLPAIALLPLAIIWFGIDARSIMFVTANAALWPMSVSFLMGLTTTPRTVLAVGRNLGLRGPRLVVDVFVPSALPHLISGWKNGWAFAWRTVVAAELVFGTAGRGGGLGWYINVSRFSLETADMMVAIFAIIVIGLITEALFSQLERRTIRRWGMA